MPRRRFFADARPLPGDWLIVITGLALVVVLFATLWQGGHATKLRIRQGDHVYATLSLAQQRTLDIHGPLGISRSVIDNGRVRFERSPCPNQ